MAKPGPEHLLVNCKHIFEQDEQPSYVSVLVLLLSLRYYISLWNPMCLNSRYVCKIVSCNANVWLGV